MSTPGRRSGVSSLALGIVTAALALLANNGNFSTGCGTWGFDCLGKALLILGCGTLLGSVLALVSLTHSGWRGGLGWLSLVVNGVPVLVLGYVGLLIAIGAAG